MVKNSVVAIIPARGGSKSIPRKNIKPLAGHPLIAYSIAAALEAKRIDRVIVSTDDDEIAAIARNYGAETPFVRPPELAGDDTTDLPVFEHALHWLAANENFSPEYIVQLRPTSPIRPKGSIDEAIEKIQNVAKADSIRGVIPSGQNPYKMWRADNGFMKPLLDDEFDEPYNMPRQKLPATYWQTGHLDVIRRATILEQKSMTGRWIMPFFIDPKFGVDIDTEDQWKFAEWLISANNLPMVRLCHPVLAVAKEIKLVVLDFDGVMTDNKVYLSQDGTETVMCDRSDGDAVVRLGQSGLPVIVLSAEVNGVVQKRCEKLKIPCYNGIRKKLPRLREIAATYNVELNQIAYLGNDINDLECIKAVRLGTVVADAYPPVKQSADWILSHKGGHGAVREFCDMLIECRKDNDLSGPLLSE